MVTTRVDGASTGAAGSRAAVLVALRELGIGTVRELADETGLSRPTVEAALADLASSALAAPDERRLPAGGRPARRWRFRADSALVLGIDLSGARVRVMVSDLAGAVLSAETGPASPADDRPGLGPVLTAVDTALARIGRSRTEVSAATVGMPGIVDAAGVLVSAPMVGDWHGVNVIELFEQALGLPVIVENDLTLAAVGEMRQGALESVGCGVYALAWHHVSARITIDGQVLQGRSRFAGEMGLLKSFEDLRIPEGSYASAVAEVDSQLRRLRSDPQDPVGSSALANLAGAMTPALSALHLAVDPDRMVLGGPLGGYADLLAPLLATSIADYLSGYPIRPQIAGAALNDSVTIGALSQAFSGLSAVVYGAPDVPAPTITVPPTLDRNPANMTALAQPASDTLTVAAIGIGARAGLAKHAAAAGGVVTAAVDPTVAGRARAADLFGNDIELYDDVESLLRNRSDLDAAIVTSPDDTHADIAVALLRAGVAVYVEKPLATTIEDCDRILQAAYDTGTKVYVGHNMRHMNVVRQLKSIIDRGEIGEVKAIWCRHFVGTGGDFYFKDWHADRRHSTGLLLQKGAHDIDVMHYLAGSASREVVGMGDLMIYGQLDSRRDNSDRLMWDWYSEDNWPPLSQTALNPVVDVEDISMVLMRLGNGVLTSYQQCHFTPDYWRNYTVIGTEGRLENIGDGSGGEIRVWDRRTGFSEKGDRQYPIVDSDGGHGGADPLTVAEFLEFVRSSAPTETSPVAAREAVAAGVAATESLRQGSRPMTIPPLPAELADYFAHRQVR